MKVRAKRRWPRPPGRLGRQLAAAQRIGQSRDRSGLPIDVYSLPVAVMAERCGVRLTTARRWKLGQARIPFAAGAVLSGHLGALSPEWIGWRVIGDALVSPDGVRITQTDLVRAIGEAQQYGYSSLNELAAFLRNELVRMQPLDDQPVPPE